MTNQQPASLGRRLGALVALFGVSVAMGACTTAAEREVTASVPNDYRLRHPIVVQESNRTVEIFVGSQRGGLSASQRADVGALAQTWLRDGTGSIVAEIPVDTPNARAAADSARDVQSLLAASGIPPRGLIMRKYRPTDPRQFATIRLTYPRIVADAGPCGTWPEDLGPSYKNKSWLENKPYYNLGCASQHNLAAMVDNPADLVQPRPESAVYTARRTATFEKFRKGTTTATTYPEADKAKLSDLGK
ncbi:MAG: CpaD family pilus assembly protein [Tardiphaga sp.]